MTAALVCVHAAELLGRVAAFHRHAALDFGGGICSFFVKFMYCIVQHIDSPGELGIFVDIWVGVAL